MVRYVQLEPEGKGLDTVIEDLWEPAEDGVPPVVGRRDPDTGEPLMRYDTAGEVSRPEEQTAGQSYEDSDGVTITIAF
jgi:hypothetical protein